MHGLELMAGFLNIWNDQGAGWFAHATRQFKIKKVLEPSPSFSMTFLPRPCFVLFFFLRQLTPADSQSSSLYLTNFLL